ncbi:hypothetical protein PPTG_08033 [Phytophthora nicotianae INRA-310]|uniref:Uncharacterized protein n=1 Tax=Phytophthora nicotianae (strain INRA-310) TaxID=761204 RepID=W2QLG5_PHYN3|nr:hypothetical protein PPTG_08033 [Phytophthora nicotianae INRA-310]ETN13100.1 hypothetical protein PPTG_08033 [Phytophthora nicotianae INRA-310]
MLKRESISQSIQQYQAMKIFLSTKQGFKARKSERNARAKSSGLGRAIEFFDLVTLDHPIVPGRVGVYSVVITIVFITPRISRILAPSWAHAFGSRRNPPRKRRDPLIEGTGRFVTIGLLIAECFLTLGHI